MSEYITETITEFINWQNIDGDLVNYRDWEPEMKSNLEKLIETLKGNGESFNLPSISPQSKTYSHVVTFLPEELANKYYLAYLAMSLFNSKKYDQFSLDQLSNNDKRIILDSRSIVNPMKSEDGYFMAFDILGKVSPSDPIETIQFLEENDLIKEDHRTTIIKLLEWCKNLRHYTGGFNKPNYIDHWGFDGYPLVSSVIKGTIKKSDQSPKIKHYTAGCHGTVGFLCLILKTLNIPVIKATAANHSQAIFNSIDGFLSHGDDPYNRTINKPGIEYSSLIIDLSEYDELYIKNAKPLDNVGYGVRVVEKLNS